MVQPIIDAEFPKIVESIEANTPVVVWFCDDERWQKDPDDLYYRTTISHWIESYLEQKIVGSKKFRVVTRTHLDGIFKEQEFQLSGHVDDDTMVSIAKIVGAKFMIVPTITRNNTLNMQILNSETGEIVYISDNPVRKSQRIRK
jgi:curli biogenesis system outer membrane secretion channel CsgG